MEGSRISATTIAREAKIVPSTERDSSGAGACRCEHEPERISSLPRSNEQKSTAGNLDEFICYCQERNEQ